MAITFTILVFLLVSGCTCPCPLIPTVKADPMYSCTVTADSGRHVPGTPVTFTCELDANGDVGGLYVAWSLASGTASYNPQSGYTSSAGLMRSDLTFSSAGTYKVYATVYETNGGEKLCQGFTYVDISMVTPTPTTMPTPPPISKGYSLKTGTILLNKMNGGISNFSVNNQLDKDLVFILTPLNHPEKPSLAVYVESHHYYNAVNIDAYVYRVYFMVGNNWDPGQKTFTRDLGLYRDVKDFDMTHEITPDYEWLIWHYGWVEVDDDFLASSNVTVISKSDFPPL